MFCEIPMLHWEGCEVTLLVGTRVCIGWLRSILQYNNDSQEKNVFMPILRPLFSAFFFFMLVPRGFVSQGLSNYFQKGHKSHHIDEYLMGEYLINRMTQEDNHTTYIQ